RVADAGAVDRAGADAADRRRDVEDGQRIGDGVHRPRDGDEDAADERDEARPESIDEIALDRYEPGLAQDEDGECDLNGRLLPMELVRQWIDEERPSVLEVGDHRHAGDAEDELPPTVRPHVAASIHGALAELIARSLCQAELLREPDSLQFAGRAL